MGNRHHLTPTLLQSVSTACAQGEGNGFEKKGERIVCQFFDICTPRIELPHHSGCGPAHPVHVVRDKHVV